MGSFKCLSPINPHMRNREMRIQIFLDHSSNWPAHRIRATPSDIADAGMYYLGDRDRVKCWYCNGCCRTGRNTIHHGRSTINCFRFASLCFNKKVYSSYISRRPTLYNPSMSSSPREIAAIINHTQSNHHEFRNESQTSHPIVVDLQNKIKK